MSERWRESWPSSEIHMFQLSVRVGAVGQQTAACDGGGAVRHDGAAEPRQVGRRGRGAETAILLETRA